MMNRMVATAACCLALAGCADTSMPSWMSFDLPKGSPASTTVQFDSQPSGAEAKTSTGQACRTPCSLAVPGNDFSVAFSLTGFQSQTIPVRVAAGDFDAATGRSTPSRVVPDPVFVELVPAPPPPPPRRAATTPPKPKKPKAPPKQAAPASAAPAAAQAPAPAPAAAWPPAPAR